jgi:glyoxylase-like metal-dependent hydrolase (beta-lactamase superfamily II)
MLGQTHRLADGLWFIQGEMPANVNDALDWCNVVIYRRGTRLYLIDSSGGPAMRESIERVLRDVGPVESATLINTHAHLDHICNNDLLARAQAAERHHYMLGSGTMPAALNAPRYFAAQFDRMDDYADPFSSYPVNRLTYRFAGLIRDSLGLFVGRERVLRWLFGIQFKKFQPVRDSRHTLEALDATPSRPLDLAGVSWPGWRLGDDDVLVLEARAHCDHDVLVYIPEHRMLCMGDVTFPLFPTWADSDKSRIMDCLRLGLSLTRADMVTLLADGHGDRCYRGSVEIEQLLDTVLSDHQAFAQILDEMLDQAVEQGPGTADGLTPAELYQAFRARRDHPVVAKYLALEFPRTPASLQNIIVTTLLQKGYPTRGPRRHQRFYRPRPRPAGAATPITP